MQWVLVLKNKPSIIIPNLYILIVKVSISGNVSVCEKLLKQPQKHTAHSEGWYDEITCESNNLAYQFHHLALNKVFLKMNTWFVQIKHQGQIWRSSRAVIRHSEYYA